MFRFLFIVVLGGIVCALIAWQFGLITPAGDDRFPTGPDSSNKNVPVANLGGPLYPPKEVEVPKADQMGSALRRDPVVFAGHMTVLDKLDVPSQLPGQLLFIGEEVPEGAVQAAGVGPFLVEPFNYASVAQADRKLIRLYRRLYEGQVVREDQMVAMLDPAKALGDLSMKRAKKGAADADARAAIASSGEADTRLKAAERLYQQKALAREELGSAQLTATKFREESVSKAEAVKLAILEEELAEIHYKQHEIRNKIPYNRSIIKTILRQGGEAVKDLEPVMQIYSLDRLLAEAMVEVEYAPRLFAGMPVTVEPIQEEAPIRTLLGHRGEINSVVVTADAESPLIVSGSEDKTVCVWSLASQRPLREFRHPEAVRVVASSPDVGDKSLIAVGCADGSLYLWDLKDDAKPLKPLLKKEAREGHQDAITALAFSPNGTFFASGSADNSIKLWRTADLRLVYAFDSEHGVTNPHQGAVTSLHFTPQGTLISAARDNTIRIWDVRDRGAALVQDPVEGRGGTVTQLGVSKDGRWMLLDRGKDLQLLSAVDGSRINTLKNPAGSVPFETVAEFSPDASLLLTAGAVEGRLQLWKAPSDGARGFEVRQFVTKERSPVSCAAFSPLAGQKSPLSFAVSGTRDGYLYVWPVLARDEVTKHRIPGARITLISSNLDASTRQVRIGVEVPNPASPEFPNGRLLPGRPVTIVID